ncbi:MAG TPA: hypothetical protein VE907_10080 [Gammaproteobacteria bacterium]|nr:hypothetical protein [Gammaproteobacteria bacterium]
MTSVQETPQVFMLLLLLCLLASLITFTVAAYRAIRGRRAGALTLLARWGLCAIAYLIVSAGVSVFKPTKIVALDQDWCFDDWCIAVERVTSGPSAELGRAVYTTDVRIFNAARSPEAVKGFWVYLRDELDRRYEPMPGSWVDVVTAPVAPHSSARTSIAFVVPQDVRELGLVTGHGSGTPCALVPSLLEIGQGGCLFHRPNMIRVL